MEHMDVLIVGAGLSGIGAACHLRKRCPQKSYAILEARESIGGTWDLFRYPGIRSDSDMFTLGYTFKPWLGAKAIADGPSILDYIRDTAREHGVLEQVRLGRRVVGAAWSSEDARWTVTIERTATGEIEHTATGGTERSGAGEAELCANGAVEPSANGADEFSATVTGKTEQMTCSFLYCCTGYYRYDEGYSPHFRGSERFAGQIVHPQHWPEDLDYTGKRVVVIGSGATAVTLVPAMIEGGAEHVTMLQRSPSYILAIPARDAIADWLRERLPAHLAYALVRYKNVLLATLTYQLSRRAPTFVNRLLRKLASRQLPAGYDVDTHLNPTYDPWDQRLCLVPDGDLFRVLGSGRAAIETGTIDTFTEDGICLSCGQELDADIVVSATGLNLLVLGGMSLTVDGAPVELSQTVAYKGMMFCGVPNLALTLGYTNASWTLKADLVAEYVCRVLAHMDARGLSVCVPRAPAPGLPTEPIIDLKSGYVLRSIDVMPKQGASEPWRLRQNYFHDLRLLRRGPIDDCMEFLAAGATPATTLPARISTMAGGLIEDDRTEGLSARPPVAVAESANGLDRSVVGSERVELAAQVADV